MPACVEHSHQGAGSALKSNAYLAWQQVDSKRSIRCNVEEKHMLSPLLAAELPPPLLLLLLLQLLPDDWQWPALILPTATLATPALLLEALLVRASGACCACL
jgi:hypothetical protein